MLLLPYVLLCLFSWLQVSKVVYVCQGREHPALRTRTALLRSPHWLSPAHAQRLAEQGWLRCEYKARYGQDSKGCMLYPAGTSEAAAESMVDDGGSSMGSSGGGGGSISISRDASQSIGTVGQQPGQQGKQQQQQEQLEGRLPVFLASAYTQLAPQDAAVLLGYLLAVFDEPAAAITPQQAFVMYDGEVCLGSALIARPAGGGGAYLMCNAPDFCILVVWVLYRTCVAHGWFVCHVCVHSV